MQIKPQEIDSLPTQVSSQITEQERSLIPQSILHIPALKQLKMKARRLKESRQLLDLRNI